MLAELAICNAAFAVIKATIKNGGEIVNAGKQVIDYFDAKARIQESATRKGGGSDIEEFMALEKLKAQEEYLRESMVYAGRPGMWDDWVAFQAKAARGRKEAKEAAVRAASRRKKKMEQLVEYVVMGIAAVVLAVLIIYGVVLYAKHIR